MIDTIDALIDRACSYANHPGSLCTICGATADMGVTIDGRVCLPCCLAQPRLAMRTVRVGMRHSVWIGDTWLAQINGHPSGYYHILTEHDGEHMDQFRHTWDDALDAVAEAWGWQR